jgi:hypothetical protein
MFNPSKRKFLFRCEDCNMIVSVEFEDEDDLADIQEDKIVLDCPCQGRCKVLRD